MKTAKDCGGSFLHCRRLSGIFSIEAGGRIEIVNYQYFHNEKLNEEVSKDYKKILPYLQIDYDKNAVSMSLSYTTSIHRPSYGQLKQQHCICGQMYLSTRQPTAAVGQ